MEISSDLISQFVKVTADEPERNDGSTVYGTVVEYDGGAFIRFDGSDLLTPVTLTSSVKAGDRVSVLVKDHTATVTGNVSDPSAGSGNVQNIGSKITEVEILIADKVDTIYFAAEVARIDNLVSENVTIKGKLEANEAHIADLEADHVSVGDLDAVHADIEHLNASMIKAEDIEAKYATIENLEAANADIRNLTADFGEFEVLTAERLDATDAVIENLNATYANIDFSNIGKAAIEEFFAKSGMIEDIVVGDGTITGSLVGVTIKGDLIEGGTVVADKLVIKGDDGLYYKLNTDGVTTETEQTDYNSLNGSVITAKSITATKISVKDLVAFDATIGGFKITDDSIYSGVKETVGNNTRGIYMDNDGQLAFGDAINFVKFYKDADGNYRLEISASSLRLGGTSRPIDEALDNAIVSTDEEFYQSSSPTELVGGSWSTSQPTWVDKMYIWRRTLVTHGDGSTEYSPSETGVCITGSTGSKGDNGDSGIGVSETEVYYYLSTSNLIQTGGSWDTRVPNWVDGRYYWQKIVTVYTNGTTSESKPVCITGGKGSNGSPGMDGQGVTSITAEFYASTSDTIQTGGSWGSIMPEWSDGMYLWTRNVIVYKNPTSTEYTDPICDSSWAAIGDAKQDALSAQESASTAQDSAQQAYSRVNQAYIDIDAIKANIASLVTGQNGETLMTQTDNGWSFNFAGVLNTLDKVTNDVSSIDSDVDNINGRVDTLNQNVEELGEYTEYIKFGVENGKPCIILGETDSIFKVVITNTDIRFMEGSIVPASISNQSLNIDKAVVNGELRQGKFVWLARSNGNYGLAWKG